MFVARDKGPKHVNFDPPRQAQCMSVDGTWCTECLVTTVSEHTAELQTFQPVERTEFFLVFKLGPQPVFRRCKLAWTEPPRIGVNYLRTEPSFLQHMTVVPETTTAAGSPDEQGDPQG